MRKALALPFVSIVSLIILWELSVDYFDVPKFLLPAPSLILSALIDNQELFLQSTINTLTITISALLAALFSGIMLALCFSLSRTFEAAFYPLAVILQVTPIVAVAPLVLIWVGIDNVNRALIIIAWLAAFFPILSNMSAGLKSVDRTLNDLFKLYGASNWQRFHLLLWPTAMPYLLASLKVSGGLALIGTVVAEFVAGSGGAQGLAWRILEAGNRLQTEKMFAGLLLLAIIGMIIFYAFSLLEYRLLKYRR